MKEKKTFPVPDDTGYDEFDNLDGMTAEEDAEAYLDAIDNAGCPRTAHHPHGGNLGHADGASFTNKPQKTIK